MAETPYNFFQSGDFSSTLTSGLNVVTGLFQSKREKQQQDFQKELQVLQNRKTELGAEYAVQLEVLKQKYKEIENDGKNDARDDWRPVIYVALGAAVLLTLVYFVTRR